jgi:hypothetical protein
MSPPAKQRAEQLRPADRVAEEVKRVGAFVKLPAEAVKVF